MNRRLFLTLLASPVAISLLDSLGASARSATPGSMPHLPTTVPATTAGSTPLGTGAGDLAAAVIRFGNDCYADLVAERPEGNVVLSPASISIALLMTLAGANGTTAQEMATTLHLTADPASIQQSAKDLIEMLDAATADGGAEGPVLSVANSVWIQDGLSLQPSFEQTLSNVYRSEAQRVDYKADAEAARKKINAWVSEKTNQRIPELLAPQTLDDESRLTLVNAIYLKAKWELPFEKQSTGPAPFKTPKGTKDVPTMGQSAHLTYVETNGWKAVWLPYRSSTLEMIVALPDDEQSLAPPPVDALLNDTTLRREPKVELRLPKFDLDQSAELAKLLAKRGMATAFTDAADFSGMTTAEPIKIGAVIHQANITVDEEGTEAAAATAVVMTAGAAPGHQDPPIVFHVDRPFSFVLVETASKAVLFQGRVTDPTVK